MWKKPSARSPVAARALPPLEPPRLVRAGSATRPATGASCALKKTTIPSADRMVKAIDINPFGRASPPMSRPIPSAHQCTPYAVNANAAM